MKNKSGIADDMVRLVEKTERERIDFFDPRFVALTLLP